jgi:hypothetical protein
MFVADGPSTGPTASSLQLFENTVRLGLAHSPLAEISGLGGGRYSHWGGSTTSNLIFSTSDNSAPRTNGRTYTIRVSPQIPAALLIYFTLPLAVFLIQRVLSEWGLLLSNWGRHRCGLPELANRQRSLAKFAHVLELMVDVDDVDPSGHSDLGRRDIRSLVDRSVGGPGRHSASWACCISTRVVPFPPR